MALLCLPSSAMWPIMSLRSSRLHNVSLAPAQKLAGNHDCSICGAVGILSVDVQLSIIKCLATCASLVVYLPVACRLETELHA